MRRKSPELMSEIKKYIEDYYLQNRQSPSTTKIAEAVGIARGTAYKYLVEMAEKNMIEYDGQEIRTNVTRKYSGEQTQTPIVGSIPCGSPQYEEENIEEYVSLPTAIFGKGDFFILRASGQSMIEADGWIIPEGSSRQCPSLPGYESGKPKAQQKGFKWYHCYYGGWPLRDEDKGSRKKAIRLNKNSNIQSGT